MADEGLLGVPMSFGIGDTLLGSLGTGLARATPKMISPYASTGTAIGLGLGSVLLQSLLGYQARQQAADRTIELNKLSTPLLGMQTAQERSDYISGLGDVDTQVLGRLSSLSGALGSRAIEQQQELDLAKRKAELDYKMELSPMAQQLAELKLSREKELAEARASVFGSRFAVGDPEKNKIMQKRFGALNLKSKTALNLLEPEEWQQLDEGTLQPNLALNLANERQRKLDISPEGTGLSPKQAEEAAGQDQIINDVTLHIEKIKSIPEVALQLAYKSPVAATALGKMSAKLADGELPEGFLANNEALAATIRKELFGQTLTGNEKRSFDIVTGKETTSSKADIIAAWDYLITRARSNLASKRKYVGMTKEEFAQGGGADTKSKINSDDKLAEQLRKEIAELKRELEVD
jgi:hypothetical protein